MALPNVPIVFCETRKLAEEWVHRFLAAAQAWAGEDFASGLAAEEREPGTGAVPAVLSASTMEIRVWARLNGIDVPDRGRLRPDVIQAWYDAHPAGTIPEAG